MMSDIVKDGLLIVAVLLAYTAYRYAYTAFWRRAGTNARIIARIIKAALIVVGALLAVLGVLLNWRGSQSGGGRGPLVYNAIAEPDGGMPDDLLHGVPTRIYFDLGPPNRRNMIGDPEISRELRQRLERESAVELAVTMTCYVCADTAPQTKSVRYVSSVRASSIATFSIVPDIVQAESRRGPSITFSIVGNGVEFDFVPVFARVKREGNETEGTPPLTRRLFTPCDPHTHPPQEPPSDLIIRLARTNEGLKISFAPTNPELARRLAANPILADDGSPNYFNTGARSPDVVTATAATTYSHLKALVDQQPSIRQQLPTVGSIDPRAQYAFDPVSEREAVRTLYELGINMYDTLFYSGDRNLSGILDVIEHYGDEHNNLRILIFADTTYLPWQLLHAKQRDGELPDPAQFWGNKYILGVVPTDWERDCGKLPGAIAFTEDKAVLYAHYWETPDSAQPNGNNPTGDNRDAVSRLGERFEEVMSKTLGNGVSVVRDKSDFKKRLKADHGDLIILWSFTHGHSGDTELAGQRLDFSQSEFISTYEIKTETIETLFRPFFYARPFVFLNGCETGTQGARGTTDLSLPGIFLMRGARAVVATEAPIWDLFGYNFGALFLETLRQGKDAGEALLATRREFLMNSKNPLGLLYSYYGNPAVRIEHSTALKDNP
jgi:hypothetical protein